MYIICPLWFVVSIPTGHRQRQPRSSHKPGTFALSRNPHIVFDPFFLSERLPSFEVHHLTIYHLGGSRRMNHLFSPTPRNNFDRVQRGAKLSCICYVNLLLCVCDGPVARSTSIPARKSGHQFSTPFGCEVWGCSSRGLSRRMKVTQEFLCSSTHRRLRWCLSCLPPTFFPALFDLLHLSRTPLAGLSCLPLSSAPLHGRNRFRLSLC